MIRHSSYNFLLSEGKIFMPKIAIGSGHKDFYALASLATKMTVKILVFVEKEANQTALIPQRVVLFFPHDFITHF